MKNKIGSVLILMLLLSGKSPEKLTNSEVDSVTIQNIEWLVGNWEGTGQLFGKQASFTMNWENVLNDKFLRLDFENNFMNSSDASRTMNATAYYKFDSDSVSGQWFDSRGMVLPLSGSVKDATLLILWGDENTERGKTSYQKVGDRIETVDYYMRDGTYHKFGDATYHKTK